MKRSKSTELRDRLSELEDTLILRILSLLPTRDVVRTTLLSKRWNGLWTSVPSLIFNHNFSEICRNFVNRTMMHWKGTKLHKFTLNFLFTSSSFNGDIDSWLHIAIEKGVEELSMNLNRAVYSPPQSLYSCSTIRKASLLHCKLDIKGVVQWDLLKSLRIELKFLSGDAIEKVMLGAPQMEILILSFKDCSENLNIHSNSLKTLQIERKKSRCEFSTVRISTPNVETLEISGIYLLGDVSSLTRAKVGFIDPSNYISVNSDIYRVLKGTSENFFQNIPHLEKVTLSGWSVKVLREIKKENKHIVAPFSNVKFLRLNATRVDDVVDILELFPGLTVLVLLHELGSHIEPQFFEIACSSTKCISEFDADQKSLPPKSDILVPHLRNVEITWAVHDKSIFRFVEILLKNVRKLEKMVLRVTGTDSGKAVVPLNLLLLASQKLLSVQKSFPAADVIMCQEED